MANRHFLLAAMLPLVACGSGDGTNPIFNGPGGDATGSVGILPGTENPSASSAIIRYEDENGSGNGYARDITYDEVADTFYVNNLAFDGNNVYSATGLGNFSSDPATVFAVYEAPSTELDPVTGTSIGQFEYRALYGRSRNTVGGQPATEFAIVRTGSFVPYGFGGFVYSRNGGVTLPTTGQAGYSGPYAAIRDFSGRSGLEYATGDMIVAIDFEDFDAGDGVLGSVSNRRIYDINGNDITGSVITALQADYPGTGAALPNLMVAIGPGTIDGNGEMSTSVTSFAVDANGAAVEFEAGNFYAVVSGAAADEVVGIISVEADDPRYDGVTVRETGGFILYRQ